MLHRTNCGRAIVINVNCGCCPCLESPKFSRTILSIERVEAMQAYRATFDTVVDPNSTSETFNIRLPDGEVIVTIPVDLSATELIFGVDDPSLLAGAQCYTVDSNSVNAAPASPDVALPIPPVAPSFSRRILSIEPMTTEPTNMQGSPGMRVRRRMPAVHKIR